MPNVLCIVKSRKYYRTVNNNVFFCERGKEKMLFCLKLIKIIWKQYERIAVICGMYIQESTIRL